jgi:hypothetical protein
MGEHAILEAEVRHVLFVHAEAVNSHLSAGAMREHVVARSPVVPMVAAAALVAATAVGVTVFGSMSHASRPTRPLAPAGSIQSGTARPSSIPTSSALLPSWSVVDVSPGPPRGTRATGAPTRSDAGYASPTSAGARSGELTRRP